MRLLATANKRLIAMGCHFFVFVYSKKKTNEAKAKKAAGISAIPIVIRGKSRHNKKSHPKLTSPKKWGSFLSVQEMPN
ncbi:MAG: hypothetical protein ACK4TN_02570, partial [Brevinematales bacterium]